MRNWSDAQSMVGATRSCWQQSLALCVMQMARLSAYEGSLRMSAQRASGASDVSAWMPSTCTVNSVFRDRRFLGMS
jgi:hypothetical protein